MPHRKKTDHQEIAATLRAARLFVGEVDAPLTAEEAAVIDETREELPRANKADLIAAARKLAQR